MIKLEQWIPGIDNDWSWAVQVFLVVLATTSTSYFVRRFLSRLLFRLGRTKTHWDDIVLQAMQRPITWMVWLLGLGIAIDILFQASHNQLFDVPNSVRYAGVLICLAWFVLGVIRGAQTEYSDPSHQLDRTSVEAIGKLVRLAVIITASLLVLQTLGFSVSGVLAMGGVGGIAIGFAARDMLANFFGGLMIYMDRPFAVGDWIRSSDREIEGVVEKIGWRISVIRNFESQPIYVPNSIFTSIIVENPSRMANRRIYETIGLRYADLGSMENIVREVKKMLGAHPELDGGQTTIVNFNEFSDSSVDFFIYCFTRTTQWVKFHQVKQDVMMRIAEIIDKHEAEIAFPTSTIYLSELSKTERQ